MDSDFYERKRRLAYVIAVLSVLLLVAGIGLGFILEGYSEPRAAAAPGGIVVAHRASRPDAAPVTRIIELDSSLQTRARRRVSGETRALIPEGDEITVFSGARYSVLKEGDTLRGADLGQNWPVLAAVRDPGRGQSWIFGWDGGNIVSRRLILGNVSEREPVAASAEVARLSAVMHESAGPLLAWREKGSTNVKTAFFDGRAFVPHSEFEIGAAEHWEVVFAPPRVILLHYKRGERTFSRLTLRARCCAACGLPPLPERIEFRDPILLIGRRVTGLAAALLEGRLLVVVARATTLQAGWLATETLQPESDRLVSVEGAPLWHRSLAALWPLLIIFCSFSLIFLGFTLLREKGQFVLEMLRPSARDGPAPADFLQRAMAFILDLTILLPIHLLAVEICNVSPETGSLDFADGHVQAMFGLWFAIHFLYHFALEWATGRTLGKRMIGIRVAEADGTRLSLRGALVRNLLRVFDADIHAGLFLGGATIIFTRRRQRLGDLAARTIVIQDRPAPAPPQGTPVRLTDLLVASLRRAKKERRGSSSE